MRNEEIEAGAGRPARELVVDFADSATAFEAETARLRDGDWAAEVRGVRGAAHPAWYTLWRRLSELEIHHVDLDAGYRPADWPADFARECLQGATASFSGPDSPAALLRATDDGSEHRIGSSGEEPAITRRPVLCAARVAAGSQRRQRPERDANRPAATCSPVVVISLDILLALKDGYSRTSRLRSSS